MDLPPAWSQACICGRVFSVPQAFSCHKRSCPKSKKRLSSALERAKEVWQARKRRKAEVDQSASEASEDSSKQNDSNTSRPSPVDVLNYTCVHPQVSRLSSYQPHRFFTNKVLLRMQRLVVKTTTILINHSQSAELAEKTASSQSATGMLHLNPQPLAVWHLCRLRPCRNPFK